MSQVKPVGCFGCLQWMQNGRDAGRYLGAFAREIAANLNKCLTRLGQLLQNQSSGKLWFRLGQNVKLFEGRFELQALCS